MGDPGCFGERSFQQRPESETTTQKPRHFLLSGGAKGKRYILPNARTMIHQPSGGAQGQATDIDIQAREILIIRERLNRLMAEHTGQPLDVIERDTERDRFMDAEQSRDYGLVDEVVNSRAAAPDA